ncbi:MAG: hypothetical protein H7263_07185 [Candidatus Sericytochromatia bacterium]|nr:hypothetical protein [Candidatus Sericytochromatia bacterium]
MAISPLGINNIVANQERNVTPVVTLATQKKDEQSSTVVSAPTKTPEARKDEFLESGRKVLGDTKVEAPKEEKKEASKNTGAPVLEAPAKRPGGVEEQQANLNQKLSGNLLQVAGNANALASAQNEAKASAPAQLG